MTSGIIKVEGEGQERGGRRGVERFNGTLAIPGFERLTLIRFRSNALCSGRIFCILRVFWFEDLREKE
ncbi:hypothetical protein Dimus_017392 [Dionaea muscipula]